MSAEEDRSPGSRSLSKSKSPDGAPSGNNSQSPVKSKKTKASKALSRSRTPKRKKHSKKRSHSRSRSGSYRYSRSRSRGKRDSYDEKRSSRRDYSKSRYRRSSSRSPSSRGRRFRGGDRDNPKESRCVGVFGMSLHTDERTIRDVFERYGPLEDVQIVYDYHTGRSRGFAFVYYKYIDDAVEAKENAPGMELDGHKIRVDFSITERAHTPTPGTYMGFKNNSYRSGGGRYRRSPSPYRRSGRYRSRSRSISRGRY